MTEQDISFWFHIGGIVLAALGLAFVSLMEAALVSVSRARLRQLTEQGHPTAPLVEQLTDRPRELLGGLILMINFFVLLAANFTTVIASRYGNEHAVIWVNLLVLAVLLIFCEVTPKTISVNFAEAIALRTARIAYVLSLLLAPIITILNGIGYAILRILITLHLLPGSTQPAPAAYSEEDIKELVTAGEQSGEVHASERDMIHGVIEFSETAAYEVMVPRTDLIALPISASIHEAIDVFMKSGHSRIPVYEEHVDNILGLLYIKDLLIRLRTRAHEEAIVIQDIVRPAYFVPETKKSDDLLREMQRKQVHMAIVVDEYGGTAGIITIEDLLEEIVGEIIDEYDQEQAEVVMLPDGTAQVSGRASLEKIHDTFDVQIPEDTEAETISGLLTEQLGRIPEVGDVVIISGAQFTVTDVSHNRIETMIVAVLPDADIQENR